MWRSENTVNRITTAVAEQFAVIGRGRKTGAPPCFAAWVDVRDVVAFVLSSVTRKECQQALEE